MPLNDIAKNAARRVATIGVVLLIALAAGAAVAYAVIPDASGIIHGCYKASDGKLRVVDSTCGSGETALDWSQTGPQGPAGADGVSGRETEQANATALAGQSRSVAVTCSSGKRALGGGFDTGLAQPGLIDVLTSAPQFSGPGGSETTGWIATFFNNDTQDHTVTVFLICATSGS
jgi:hypothetical protein